MKEEEKLREINSLSEQTSSGDGSSAESCMLESEYERLEKEGKIKNRVYVCGLGWMLPTVVVYGCGCGYGEEDDVYGGEEYGYGYDDKDCGCCDICLQCGLPKDYCICENKDDPNTDETGNETGNGTGNGAGNGTGNGTGGSTGGTIVGNQDDTIVIILTADKFSPFIDTPEERAGCLRRCIEMLKETDATLTNNEPRTISMAIDGGNGRCASPSDDFQRGIDYIESQLQKNKGVIVGVDRKDGHSYNSVNDTMADHYVIIIGYKKYASSSNTIYYFYDPATQHTYKGTSLQNVFYMKNNMLYGTFYDKVDYYIISHIRLNK